MVVVHRLHGGHQGDVSRYFRNDVLCVIDEKIIRMTRRHVFVKISQEESVPWYALHGRESSPEDPVHHTLTPSPEALSLLTTSLVLFRR